MNRSAARHFIFSSAIIFFAAAIAMPALAQRGGGGGHAGSGGAHFSAGGSVSTSHASSSSTSHATYSSTSSGTSHTPIPSAGVRTAGVSPAFLTSPSTSHLNSPSHTTSAYSSSAPRNVTIGFPPREGLPFVSRASRPRLSDQPAINNSASNSTVRQTSGEGAARPSPASHMSFYGDGNEIWAEPSQAVRTASACPPWRVSPANLNLPLPSRSVPVASTGPNWTLPLNLPSRANTETQNQIQPRGRDAAATKTAPASPASVTPAAKPLFGTPIATPPARPRHPIFTGNNFGGLGFGGNSRGFGYGFFGFGWDLNAWSACDPAFTQSFGCNAFADPAFGNAWEPAITWYPADASGDISGDASNCGDPCTNTWQDPPSPAAAPVTEPDAAPPAASPDPHPQQ